MGVTGILEFPEGVDMTFACGGGAICKVELNLFTPAMKVRFLLCCRCREKRENLQLQYKLLQVALRALLDHDVAHLLAHRSDLRPLGVAGLLDLVVLLLREADARLHNKKNCSQMDRGGRFVPRKQRMKISDVVCVC